MNVKRHALLCVLLQAYYYSAIVEDVLLRFGWILTVTVTTLVTFDGISDIFATVLAPLEVFRYAKSFYFPNFASLFIPLFFSYFIPNFVSFISSYSLGLDQEMIK